MTTPQVVKGTLPTSPPSTRTLHVQIFLHDSAQLDDPTTVQAVGRTVSVTDERVATAALDALAAGATPEESRRGLYSEVHALLKGASACDGTAFRVTVDANGRAIVRLCQPVFSPGVLADARFAAEVRATLRQFSTVREIRILTHDGHCFGDESGRDQCLSSP